MRCEGVSVCCPRGSGNGLPGTGEVLVEERAALLAGERAAHVELREGFRVPAPTRPQAYGVVVGNGEDARAVGAERSRQEAPSGRAGQAPFIELLAEVGGRDEALSLLKQEEDSLRVLTKVPTPAQNELA
jgi:hypothetical protein